MNPSPQSSREAPVPTRSSASRWLNRHTAILFLLPATFLVLALAIIPAISSLVLSLQDRRLTAGKEVGWAGFDNYVEWLSDPAFWSSVRLTLVYTVGSVTLQLLLGLAVALLLDRKFPGRNLLRALLLVPWVLPIVSTANIWVWMLNETYGIIDTTLLATGLIRRPVPWLSSPDLSLISAIMVKTWREFPFAALLLTAGLQTIPAELYEAAKLDGATVWQRFRHVTLNGLKLVITVILLLQTIWTFNDMSTVYLLTKGGPGTSSEVISILVYRASFVTGDLSRGAAGAVLMFVVVAILAAFYFRFYLKSEAEVRE